MEFSDLLMEGVSLMLLGMGSVFVFLAVLVVALNGMSKLAAAIGVPEESKTAAAAGASEDDAELIAVITAAINMFKAKNK